MVFQAYALFPNMTGQLAESDMLLRRHRQREGGLNRCAPCIPGRALKPGTESFGVPHYVDDRRHDAPSLPYFAARRTCGLCGGLRAQFARKQ